MAALVLLSIAGMGGWYWEHRHVAHLEARVAELQQNEMRSMIDKSVSDQLGVIASQQRDLAEEQRAEAQNEKLRADEAFLQSEAERRKAEEAERQARTEKEKADSERLKADEARRSAEASEQRAKDERNKADTLRYQTLGRSLGSASRQALAAHQDDMALLLAYYSYHYTTQNGGTVYLPEVFQSLLNASNSRHSWLRHRGQIRGIDFMPVGDDRLLTACDFGSILIHQKKNGQLKTDTLFSNSNFDFRYLFADRKGTIYAASRSGHLLVNRGGDPKRNRIIPVLQKDHPMALWVLDERRVIVVGEHALAEVDLSLSDDKAVADQVELGFSVTAQSHDGEHLLLFDDRHREHLVMGLHDIRTADVKVPGRVTAFGSTKKTRAYGMADGSIYVLTEGSSEYKQLLGHESRISKLKINEQQLFTASYDGKVNFWYVNNGKIEPMEMLSQNCWILDFTTSNDRQCMWIADRNGYVTEALLDAAQMKDIIEVELKRKQIDLTQEDWEYYIGKDTPYQPLIVKKGKEDSQ